MQGKCFYYFVSLVCSKIFIGQQCADGGYGRVEQIQDADLRMCFCHESLVSTSYRRRNLHQANNLSELTPVHLSNPEINLRQQEK